ncbi:hypothetical protein AB0A71_24790 [Kitasatospora aureofaciens]|uniref:hypothetical protein n=1 Tax=Kitasatospora aureofaciens TaxID=1894 RepID=UPI0033C387D6
MTVWPRLRSARTVRARRADGRVPRRGRAAPSGSWSPRGWASAFVAEAAEPAERSARLTALRCHREARVKAYGGRLIQALGGWRAPSPLLLIDPGPLGAGPVGLCDIPVPGPHRAAVAPLGGAPG